LLSDQLEPETGRAIIARPVFFAGKALVGGNL
jgi:hypothetical protein